MPSDVMESRPAVLEGQELWRPSPDMVAGSHLRGFTLWLGELRGLRFEDYEDLWRWSVAEPDAFWSAVWAYFEVISSTPYVRVRCGPEMPGARWFEGARVNYAEHVLRAEAACDPDKPAFYHATETRDLSVLTWGELGAKVRALATRLRSLGLRPGDRVVSYLPNVPEAVVALLAVTAVGAVWAAAAPEFGARTVVDRFEQIRPRMAFVTDGYIFGGKTFDRRPEVETIVSSLPSLEHVVWLPYVGLAPPSLPGVTRHVFEDLLKSPGPPRESFVYERVASDHPLWVLFSSGTTGKPKAIAHSHAGIIAEHLKYMHLHLDLGPDSCMFFYTTTGWMIWNTVVSALLTGASAVLYDGNPVHGGPEFLWRLADDAGVTLFGASPTLVQNMKAAGVRPGRAFGLERLRAIILAGAPSTPETYQWFYAEVKPDLWVTSQSGGTELCSGLVGGVVDRPVYAGEMQGRMLGMDVHAWNDAGEEVVDQVGELVVTSPFPSMPIYFWGDEDGARYREAYFGHWPGVWRHGDLLKINSRGGCFIYGRSDATLNRHGVRIGTAEIYGVLDQLDGIQDSLVVCCELPNGGYFMPLFVTLKPGFELSEQLVGAIRRSLREQASPRHVPDGIWLAPQVPYTLTGKKMEIPVRRIIMGADIASVASPDAMANPGALDWYGEFAARPEIAAMRGA